MTLRTSCAVIVTVLITALVGVMVNVSVAHASTVTFVTPTGSTESGGHPVNASATFTTNPGSVSVTLTNLQANPTDVSQTLGAVLFMFSTFQSSGTLTSSSTTPITVASNGTFTLGSSGSTGWVVFSPLGGLELAVSGTSMAIIGPPGVGGTYSNANSTIAGNGTNNPFSDLSATFTIANATLTAASTITVMEFVFGATQVPVNHVVGVPVPSNVPIPAALPLFATGLGALGLLGWRRKRKAAA
jgi:hypothetical protein